jgi:hypothetical protein
MLDVLLDLVPVVLARSWKSLGRVWVANTARYGKSAHEIPKVKRKQHRITSAPIPSVPKKSKGVVCDYASQAKNSGII